MNEQRIINEIRELRRIIKDIPEEPINETEACKFLGITNNTMRIYVSQGKMAGKFVINCLGKRMYYKSKLVQP